MTLEEKQLLFKHLCARLPYGVKCRQHKLDSQVCTMHPEYLKNTEDVEEYEPYLRPMSSMTEEEKILMATICLKYVSGNVEGAVSELSDFYNSRHLDYRGLISMGLALEAPEGMYKTE